jgi:hypothetical protein
MAAAPITDIERLTFMGRPIAPPDFSEVRASARALAECACDMENVPDCDRERIIREMVDRMVMQIADMMVELYGPKGA